jgi:hypothetical protein
MEATQDRTGQPQETITEFLEARIAEEEAVAREIADCESHDLSGQGYEGTIMEAARSRRRGYITVDPARVLAECAAKREIIELHHQSGLRWVGFPRADRQEAYCVEDQHASPCGTLLALAAVYASHPDYRQEWADRG